MRSVEKSVGKRPVRETVQVTLSNDRAGGTEETDALKGSVLEGCRVLQCNVFNQGVAAQPQPVTRQQRTYVEVSTGCQASW